MTAVTAPMSSRGYYVPVSSNRQQQASHVRHYNHPSVTTAPAATAYLTESQKPPRTQAKRAIGHYILGRTIGEGTFGKVKLGTHILTGEKVAIKILEKEKIVDISDVERVSREIKILKLIRHPHIVQLYEIIETHRQLYLIMEYAPGGELFDYIVDNQRVNEDEACKFFRQIICGVEKIHELGVVHRDLKPENLLLDEEKNIKIVDFGLSNTFDKGQLLKTACGSPCYAAPEMIAGKSYVPYMCDIWSCGVILFALVCGYLPFEDQNTAQLYKKIMSGHYQTPNYVTASVKSLIKGLLTTNPERRMRVSDIRRHPWFLGEAGGRTTLSRELNFAPGSSKGCEVSSCDRCKTWAFGGTDPTDPTSEFGVDDDVLNEVVKIGDFSKEYAIKCLKINKHNHVTTSYYLLLEKKTRHAMELRKAGRGDFWRKLADYAVLAVPLPADTRSSATIVASVEQDHKVSPKKVGGNAKDAELFEKFDRITQKRASGGGGDREAPMSGRNDTPVRDDIEEKPSPLALKMAEESTRPAAPPSEASSAQRSGRDMDTFSSCTSPGQQQASRYYHGARQGAVQRPVVPARRKVPTIPIGRVNLNDGLDNSPRSVRGYVPRGAPPPQSARVHQRPNAATPRLYELESPKRYVGGSRAPAIIPPLSSRLRSRRVEGGQMPQSARVATTPTARGGPTSVADRLYQRAGAPSSSANGGSVRTSLNTGREALDGVTHRPATTGFMSARSPTQPTTQRQQAQGYPVKVPTPPATARPSYGGRPPSTVAGRSRRLVLARKAEGCGEFRPVLQAGLPSAPQTHRPSQPVSAAPRVGQMTSPRVSARRSSHGGNPPSTSSSISNTMPCSQPPILTVTTTKDPRTVLHDTYRALAALGIQSTRTEPFNISCNRTGLQFDLEITQLDKVQSVYVVRFRKTVGDHSQFREVTRRLVQMLKLERLSGGCMSGRPLTGLEEIRTICEGSEGIDEVSHDENDIMINGDVPMGGRSLAATAPCIPLGIYSAPAKMLQESAKFSCQQTSEPSPSSHRGYNSQFDTSVSEYPSPPPASCSPPMRRDECHRIAGALQRAPGLHSLPRFTPTPAPPPRSKGLAGTAGLLFGGQQRTSPEVEESRRDEPSVRGTVFAVLGRMLDEEKLTKEDVRLAIKLIANSPSCAEVVHQLIQARPTLEAQAEFVAMYLAGQRERVTPENRVEPSLNRAVSQPPPFGPSPHPHCMPMMTPNQQFYYPGYGGYPTFSPGDMM
ncbi:hypothetical protein FOL47_003576 [Perkinsus chesapeaki]|uniref:non-specific serine/threonine protein kinase n=1 Tax=Perkinsus chesapeaki TaxID=330153 RepID=A0A7J6M7J9_PERCH|nr:hypothetical protein FOL47_003576 [Perkinsus chesapeaki]